MTTNQNMVAGGPAPTQPTVNPSTQPAETAALDETRPGRFRIQLCGGPPLTHNPLEIDAASPMDAQQQFFAHNGISRSDHPLKVERVEAPAA